MLLELLALLFLASPARAGVCPDGKLCVENERVAVGLVTEIDGSNLQDAGPGVQKLSLWLRGHSLWAGMIRPLPKLQGMIFDYRLTAHYADGDSAEADHWLLSPGETVREAFPPFIISKADTDLSPGGTAFQVFVTFPRQGKRIKSISLEAIR